MMESHCKSHCKWEIRNEVCGADTNGAGERKASWCVEDLAPAARGKKSHAESAENAED